MRVQETIRRETLKVAAGTLVLTGVMLVIFALLGKMDYTVVLGAVLGCAVAVLDFFLLGLTVQSAAELQATVPAVQRSEDDGDQEPEETQEQLEVSKQIRRKMQLSQMGRLLMMAVCAGLGAAAPCFHLVATVLPLLFPKTVIYARQLLEKK